MSASPALRRVVVFGATSAMAQATTRILAARGAELVLVGRDPAKLEAVAGDARTRGASSVVALQADLDDTARHAELLASAAEALGGIDVVLVAQGVLFESDACEADLGRAEQVLRTNFVAPALLCAAAASRLSAQGSGTLVAISSVAGDRGRQSNYVYGSAKGGLSIFLEGLRNRMFPRGVRVVTVKPGFVESPMTDHVPRNALFAPASAVATAIVRAVENRKDVVYVPAFWRYVMLVIRHVPERVFKRLHL